MAPDRGPTSLDSQTEAEASSRTGLLTSSPASNHAAPSSTAGLLADRANDPRNFTLRGVLVGLVIGIVICFSNMYFGLQTGWISTMAMPSALLGFSYFKLVGPWLAYPFTPVENVLVQSVAGAVGTMPLGCGFVGVIPALNFLLAPGENGPLPISLWKLVVWGFGIAFFGVVFAVPLRKQVIIREKLKFPSGTASALMIGVLHGEKDAVVVTARQDEEQRKLAERRVEGNVEDEADEEPGTPLQSFDSDQPIVEMEDKLNDWKARVRLLFYAFAISATYTLFSYFVPLNNVPLFGKYLAKNWLWTVNFSPAYVGQGVIMGAPTCLSMLLGAVVGYGILSPLAKSKGWAPGPVDDWANGSKGWIVWVSLAIMLADSLVSLGWLITRPVIRYGPSVLSRLRVVIRENSLQDIVTFRAKVPAHYSALRDHSHGIGSPKSIYTEPEEDAPPEHLISPQTTWIGLFISSILCIAAVHITFGNLIPLHLTIVALFFAMILSVMGLRALGETDLNPVSGISKLTQLIFALFTPQGSKNAIIINLIAGALSESGALQAGDLMQDLKTGHLLGAAPNAQFYGQIIGCAVGAVVSATVYKLYTRVYEIPGALFEVPTSYVWIYTARLVTGQGLPEKVPEWALGAAVLFSVTTILRMWLSSRPGGSRIANFIPGGIAVAVGIYNTPSFTIARAVGGILHWYWTSYKKRSEIPVIVIASGLILGEGLFSIVNLLLASAGVPHL